MFPLLLAEHWVDPDFDPGQSVRVLEIPTPRWTAYDDEEIGALGEYLAKLEP